MPSSNQRYSNYSRFIPGEEIESFTAWDFGSVDEAEAAAKAALLQKPVEEVPVGPSPEELAAAAEAERLQALQAAYQEGHAAGCVETRAALEAPLSQAQAQMQAQWVQLQQALQQQYLQLHEQLAETVLDMAVAMTRQMVRRELALDPESVRPVIVEALQQLGNDTRPVTIRLHPDDLAALGGAAHGLPDDVQCMSDAKVTPGGCVLQGAGSSIDATVEHRWKRVIGNLGLQAAWQEGETSSVPASDVEGLTHE